MTKDSFKKKMFVVALLFTTLTMMAETPLTPASDILYKTFSNTAAVDLLLSIPTLIAMFSSIIFGFLMLKINKKYILTLGVICYCVGGICGHLIDSLAFMIGMRAIIGIGLGACNVSAIAIASDQSETEEERQKLTSYITAGISISAMLLTFLAGQLTNTFGWQSVFTLYWSGIPMLILVILFVPRTAPSLSISEDASETDSSSEIKKIRILPFSLQMLLEFFWFLTYGVVFFQISVYLSDCNIGNAALAGSMSSLTNFVAFFSSLAFPHFYRKYKYTGSFIHYLALCVGYIILWLFRTPATVVIACVLLGYGFGYSLSFFSIHLGQLVPRSKSSIAATAYSAIMGIGMFMSTFTVSALKRLLHTDSITDLLPYIILAAFIGTVCSLAVKILEEKK